MAFLIVFGAGTMLLGATFVISIIVTRSHHEGTANWPEVPGLVKTAYVYQHDRSTSAGTTTTYTPVVSYTYTVTDRDYQSYKRNALPYDRSTFTAMGEVRDIVSRYAPGSSTKVFYNPNNAAQSLLEKPKALAHMTVLWYGVICILLGGGMIALGILV